MAKQTNIALYLHQLLGALSSVAVSPQNFKLGGDIVIHADKQMWKINIENAAFRAAAEVGSSVVDSVFARYDAHSLCDLASCYYSEVFADLEQIANDN